MPRSRFHRLLAAARPVSGLLAALALLAPPPAVQAQGQKPAYVPGEVLVQFKANASEAQKADALAQVAGGVRRRIHTRAMRGAGAHGIDVAATGRVVPDAV